MMKGFHVALLVVIVMAFATAAQTRKPVKEELFSVDYQYPPSDIAGMTSGAAAVVIADYEGQARVVEGAASLDRSTFYTFRIVEIIKLHHELPPVGSDLELELLGGEKEYPTYIERSRDREMRELKKNSRLVLFLSWNWRLSTLQLAWGPLGMYDITDGLVTSLRPGRGNHDKKAADVFLTEVRAIK